MAVPPESHQHLCPLLPVPPVSVPSAHSLLLVASTSAGLGAAGTVTRGCDCSSWPLMSLWRGPGAAPPRSCSSQISGEPVGRCPGSCQGCLGGLGTPVAAAHGWRGSGYLARVSLWDSPHPASCSMTFAVTVPGSSPEARGGHVPAMPGVPENGQVQTGCDHLAWGVLSLAVPEEQPKERLGCSFPIPDLSLDPFILCPQCSCTSRTALLQCFTGFLVHAPPHPHVLVPRW